MSTTQEKKQAFIDSKVITDVLPGNIELSYDLLVKWPNTTLDAAGAELDYEDTQPQPTLRLSPAVSLPRKLRCDGQGLMPTNTALRTFTQPCSHHV